MTPADIMFALSLVDITEGNSRLTDLTFHNVSSLFSGSLKSSRDDLAQNIVRLYIWGWLMVGYELGHISSKGHARDVSEDDMIKAYSKIFKQLEQYDESLLMPVQDRIERIDVLYAGQGSTSMFKNMIAVMSAWMCEVGMLIARRPHILRTKIHYGT